MTQLSLQINTVEPRPPEHDSTRYIIETIRVRLNVAEPLPTKRADSSDRATAILQQLFATLEPDQEHFLILGLTAKNTVLHYKLIASGGQTSTIIDPKLVFRHALLMGSTRIILAHSHPSGDPTPSAEDHLVTKKLVHVGQDLDLPVIDHIIIAPSGRSYSFLQSGYMPT